METHLGPDGTRLKQNAQARLQAYLSMLANWCMKMQRERETDLKKWDEGKEDHGHSQQIKLNNFTVSLGTRERKSYPISTATEAWIVQSWCIQNLIILMLFYLLYKCNHFLLFGHKCEIKYLKWNEYCWWCYCYFRYVLEKLPRFFSSKSLSQ